MEYLPIDVMADPGVKQASDKLTAFKTEFNDLERRVVENNNKLLRLRGKNPVAPVERAAKALVAGTKFKDLDGEIAASQGEYPKLCARRAVVARAVELQRKVLVKEETRASEKICAELLPEYRANVAALAKHMIALGKAQVVDITFFDNLTSGGVKHGRFMGMRVKALGDPRDRNGWLAMWLQEAIAFGLIDEATVPADWRERWNR